MFLHVSVHSQGCPLVSGPKFFLGVPPSHWSFAGGTPWSLILSEGRGGYPSQACSQGCTHGQHLGGTPPITIRVPHQHRSTLLVRIGVPPPPPPPRTHVQHGQHASCVHVRRLSWVVIFASVALQVFD